jgi:hypothetical protein
MQVKDEELPVTIDIEHPLQVFRGFKDKITTDPKKREKLIKAVAFTILNPSFLPYAGQYSEKIATFLTQLTVEEVSDFYKNFDEAFGSVVGEYENTISKMFSDKLEWKKALVQEKEVSSKILDAIFKKPESSESKEEEEPKEPPAEENSCGDCTGCDSDQEK